MVDWNELWKIRLNQYSDEFLTHEVVKLIIVKNILQKYHSKKSYQEIYTEYPICKGKVADVYWKNNLTKEIIYFEIQKNLSEKWLKETKDIYDKLEGDLVIIDLNKLSDNLSKINEQVKELIP